MFLVDQKLFTKNYLAKIIKGGGRISKSWTLVFVKRVLHWKS